MFKLTNYYLHAQNFHFRQNRPNYEPDCHLLWCLCQSGKTWRWCKSVAKTDERVIQSLMKKVLSEGVSE
jgi:hypothetical protein